MESRKSQARPSQRSNLVGVHTFSALTYFPQQRTPQATKSTRCDALRRTDATTELPKRTRSLKCCRQPRAAKRPARSAAKTNLIAQEILEKRHRRESSVATAAQAQSMVRQARRQQPHAEEGAPRGESGGEGRGFIVTKQQRYLHAKT